VALPASALESPLLTATAAIKSFLFIRSPYGDQYVHAGGENPNVWRCSSQASKMLPQSPGKCCDVSHR
jgi:hypothetical protein